MRVPFYNQRVENVMSLLCSTPELHKHDNFESKHVEAPCNSMVLCGLKVAQENNSITIPKIVVELRKRPSYTQVGTPSYEKNFEMKVAERCRNQQTNSRCESTPLKSYNTQGTNSKFSTAATSKVPEIKQPDISFSKSKRLEVRAVKDHASIAL